MGNAALQYQHPVELTPIVLFKALSDNTRLASILLIASEDSVCVCELEHALEEEQPKISRHLALLRKDNILDTERHGKWVYYRLCQELPSWARQIIELTLTENRIMVNQLKQNLATMSNRPSCC